MATTIFDISKKLGIDAKAVLAKAKALGIVSAKVVSSSVDNLTAEWLVEALVKTNPIVLERRSIFGTANDFKRSNADSAITQYMRPNLKGRRIETVSVNVSWDATLRHRVYSCPDTSEFDFVLGATALILEKALDVGRKRIRIPLEVCAVTRLAANNLESLSGLSQPFRERAEKYLAEVGNDVRIIRPGCAHRLYFLGTEPWTEKMRNLTVAASEVEWSAVLSICADPDRFFRWSRIGGLLWPGCIRTENDGEHKFPAEVLSLLNRLEIKPDTRTNGPAINSFEASGGERPSWGGGGWHVHHVFDGTEGTPHAVKDGSLFTHSAGLVATHPIAHHLAHQSALLKWLLRREAFLRFGFDPNGDFAAD